MRRLALSLFVWLFACAAAVAQVGLAFPGPGTVHSTGGGGYTGPCDVSTCAVAYSLRAVSAADRGNKAVNVCLPAGTPCADFVTDATTGNLITSAGLVTTCNNTTVKCVINTKYDHINQLGTNHCTGGTCDLIDTTLGQQEILVLPGGCTNTSLACEQTVPSQATYTSVGSLAQAQPYMISWLGEELGNNGSYSGTIDLVTGWPNVTNAVFIWAGGGSIVNATAAINVWHASQALFNGNSSSTIYVDGTSNAALNIGTAGLSGVINYLNGNSNGNFLEEIILNGDQSANNATVNSNQHTWCGC